MESQFNTHISFIHVDEIFAINVSLLHSWFDECEKLLISDVSVT